MHEHLNACQRPCVVGGRNACHRLMSLTGERSLNVDVSLYLLPSREERSVIVLICFFESEY